MKKRIVTIALVVALLATCFAGTYAYLQDTDSAKNTMTLGNVDIEQTEWQRVQDENGNFVEGEAGVDFNAAYGITRSCKLEKFQQDKPAYPAVGGEAWGDFQQLWNSILNKDGTFAAPGSNDLFSMRNVIDKFVFVENTGKSDVYFRTIVLVESPEDVSANMIHVNMNNNTRYKYSSDGTKTDDDAEGYVCEYVVVDNTRYAVYVATHTEILPAGEIARPSLLQVHLDHLSTNNDSAAFGEKWEVLTLTQAVQAQGFDDAWSALNEAFGKVTPENLDAWF